MHDFTELTMDKLVGVFASEKGYQTPKVDVRGVVFREDKILMVRETIDDCWSVPGGWADVGLTPFEVARKEVFEESDWKLFRKGCLQFSIKNATIIRPTCIIFTKFSFCAGKQGENSRTAWKPVKQDFFGPDELPPLSRHE